MRRRAASEPKAETTSRSLRRWSGSRGVAGALLAGLLGSACISVPVDEVLPPLAAASHAREGGALKVGIVRPGSIHPTLASSPGGQLVSSLVCDTLVHIDPETGEFRPGLAEQVVVSGDGKAVTFKLRRGVIMHDGTELSADDVFEAMHRLADPQEGSYLQGMLEGIVGFPKFSGRELEEGEDRPSRMGGVETLERYGFQVRLQTSKPHFIRKFAHPALAPFSADAFEANPLAFSRDPVCAGPYQLAQPYDPDGDRIRLVRDQQFDGLSSAVTNAGNGYVDEVEFRLYDDRTAVLAAYEAGEVDVANVPTERYGAVAEQFGPDVVEGPDPSVEYVGFPVSGLETALGIEVGARDRFDELAVRHALSLALDREALAAALHDGARLPATSFTPPSAGPYHEREPVEDTQVDGLAATSIHAAEAVERDGARYCQELLPSAGDVARARALLREQVVVGPDGASPVAVAGTSLPFYFNDEFGNAAFVEQVARQWRESLGLEVRPVALTWDEYLDRATSGSGFDGFYRFSWADSGLVPEGYLRAIADQAGQANLGRFADETVTRLFAELGQVGGEDHRLEYHELEDVLCAMIPAIPVTFARSRWLVRDGVVGTARDEVIGRDGQILLRELFVEG
ncbi:MAG TPA: ABC transporter substrate-binding protein [Nitriliruptorales bacterium]